MNPDDFKSVMRNLAAGVTVVTTVANGESFGMTATSFTSVSLEPMLVQVALDLASHTHDAVKQSGVFAVNILSIGQEKIATDFATADIDRFERCETTRGPAGLPLLVGSIGYLECRVVEQWPAGDHTIFLGEVVEGDTSDGIPLLYFKGKYRRLADLEEDEQ